MRHVTDAERRTRLAVRHALVPTARVETPEEVVRALTVLHSTEPATVYLACQARSEVVQVDDVDRALLTERSLVKQLAMRRTLFVFGRDLLPAALGSASARVAEAERGRTAREVVKAGVAADGDAWLDLARAETLGALREEPDGLDAATLRARVPMLDVWVEVSAGAAWRGASRVLTHLGLTGDVVRGGNNGHWRLSRPRWTLMSEWLGEKPTPWPSEKGYTEMVRRWLLTFGPGTEADLVWWLGATKTAVRDALAVLDATAVTLDGGGTGWLLPDDVEPVDGPGVDGHGVDHHGVDGHWVALLPVLDPTVMGWKERGFYLGAHGPELFDRNGNAGTTAWVDGRVVGCWTQDEAGRVGVHLLEDVGRAATRALDAEAERLTAWLAGVRVGTIYPSPAMKRARK